MPNYSVWLPNAKPPRWIRYYGSNTPYPVRYTAARKIADEYRAIGDSDYIDAEVREIGPDNQPIGGAVLFARTSTDKSSGMACVKCGDWNDYGQSNQSDGSYCCFPCRRR
jgi:hypothetical protein